jgi:hypothetical protein
MVSVNVPDDSGYSQSASISGSAGVLQRVTLVERDTDYLFVQTDANYVAPTQPGGTVQLAIPSDEHPLYQVGDPINGTGFAIDAVEKTFINQDPLPNRNIGVNRFIYARFARAGSYKLAIRSRESVAAGGR